MGNCVAVPPDAGTTQIDKMLAAEQQRLDKQVRMLLLGASESGKSTIFKQMKLLQDKGGFTPEELAAFRFAVLGKCVFQMRILLSGVERLGLELSPQNMPGAQSLSQLPSITPDAWTNSIGGVIKQLWTDPAVRAAYERREQLQLDDSADYFFEQIDRFIPASYQPTEQDVLRVRIRTTGVEVCDLYETLEREMLTITKEAEFKFEGFDFQMIDVGGQRSERRKWIDHFDRVTAVVFCVSMAEYDQTLREDPSSNRMKESLLLFDEILNGPWFANTPFILFLNKKDILQEKIKRKDLTCCFADYKGGNDYEAASAYIKNAFTALNVGKKTIYPHFTCAIDKENMRFVFRAVREIFLKDALTNVF